MSDYTADDDQPGVIAYRLRELGRNVRDLMLWRRDVDKERALLAQDAKALAVEMAELKKVVDSLRKTILGFALTIAISAVTFALTVLIATGKIGGK